MWSKIDQLLKDQHMSLYELAKQSGIAKSTIYNFKYGNINKPSFELVEKIADVLGVSMDEFRGDRNEL